jgi:formylglycine-generating enzyme required for sulfatase activity
MKLDEHGVHAVLATHPVTRGEYKEYLRVSGLAIPPSLARIAPPSVPVTDVSRVDAVAYCEWLGRRESRPYRLPTIAELLELAAEAEEDGISDEVWPHQRGHRPEVRGGMKEMFLCEWTWKWRRRLRTLASRQHPGRIFIRRLRHSHCIAQAHLRAGRSRS